MRIAIIGATGRTGRLAAESALNRGYDVTAIVRSPDKLGELAARVRVATAEATDVDALAAGIGDADVVISVLGHGPTSGDRVLVDGVAATLEAMRRTKARRLTMISAAGHETDGDGWFTRTVIKPVLGLFLRDQFEDMRLAEAELRASDVDWTIVRPPMLRDGEPRGYISREWLNVRGAFTMNRTDLAESLLDLTIDGPARTIVAVAGAQPRRQRRSAKNSSRSAEQASASTPPKTSTR